MTHLKMGQGSKHKVINRRNKLAEQQLKKWSLSFAIRETQITLLFYLTLVRMAKINKTTNTKCWLDGRGKRNFCSLLVGMQVGVVTANPQKTEQNSTICPSYVLLVICPKDVPYSSADICSAIFVAALLTRAREWKEFKCP